MRRLPVAALAVAAALGALPAVARAVTRGCSTDSNGQVACTIKTGVAGVTAVDHGTGLDHASGYQDVDVINLSRPCRLVRLYYLFGFQGDSHVLPPMNVPIRHAAIIGSPPAVYSPAWLTAKIRVLLGQERLPGAPSPSTYSLPYPSAYWYVYIVHTEAEVLSRGGVRCVRS